MDEHPRLVIGISGASGVIYGVRLLEMLRALPVETHLVMTKAAEVALAHETNGDMEDLSRPLSHAALIKHYLEGEWPSPPAPGVTPPD